jgi:hypothetical protein
MNFLKGKVVSTGTAVFEAERGRFRSPRRPPIPKAGRGIRHPA